jgi:hypothetical protein
MTAYLDGAVAASVAQTVTTTVASARAARILLVEDSASIRALMLSILEKAGHTVVQAADGQGAMQAIGSGSPCDVRSTGNCYYAFQTCEGLLPSARLYCGVPAEAVDASTCGGVWMSRPGPFC